MRVNILPTNCPLRLSANFVGTLSDGNRRYCPPASCELLVSPFNSEAQRVIPITEKEFTEKGDIIISESSGLYLVEIDLTPKDPSTMLKFANSGLPEAAVKTHPEG